MNSNIAKKEAEWLNRKWYINILHLQYVQSLSCFKTWYRQGGIHPSWWQPMMLKMKSWSRCARWVFLPFLIFGDFHHFERSKLSHMLLFPLGHEWIYRRGIQSSYNWLPIFFAWEPQGLLQARSSRAALFLLSNWGLGNQRGRYNHIKESFVWVFFAFPTLH